MSLFVQHADSACVTNSSVVRSESSHNQMRNERSEVVVLVSMQ